MLVTPVIDRQNHRHALTVSVVVAVVSGVSGWLYPPLVVALTLAPVSYWLFKDCCRHAAVEPPGTNPA